MKSSKDVGSILFFFFLWFLFIYLFLAVLGLRFCARAFSSCGKRGPSSLWCTGLSLLWPLLLWSTGSRRAGSVVVAHGPSCMWDLPRTGLEPVSPALAGRFSTTVPPGKPLHPFFASPIPRPGSLSKWLKLAEPCICAPTCGRANRGSTWQQVPFKAGKVEEESAYVLLWRT